MGRWFDLAQMPAWWFFLSAFLAASTFVFGFEVCYLIWVRQ